MIPDFMLVIGCSIFISISLLARAQYDQMLEIKAAQKLPPKQVATVVLFIGFFKYIKKTNKTTQNQKTHWLKTNQNPPTNHQKPIENR